MAYFVCNILLKVPVVAQEEGKICGASLEMCRKEELSMSHHAECIPRCPRSAKRERIPPGWLHPLIFGHPSVHVREVCTSLRIRAIRGDSRADIIRWRSLQSLHCLSVRMQTCQTMQTRQNPCLRPKNHAAPRFADNADFAAWFPGTPPSARPR